MARRSSVGIACFITYAEAPFFSAATHRPIVVTHRRAPGDEAVRASKVADVLVVPTGGPESI